MLGHLLPGIHTKLSKFGTATRVAVSVNNDPSYRSEHLICQLMQDYAALDVAVRTRIQVAIRQNYSLQLSVLTETPTDALVNQIIYRAVMDRIMVWHNPQIVIIPVAEKDRMKRMEFKVDLPGQDTGVNFEKCLYESCDTPPGIIENDGIWCYAVTLIALIITAKVPSTQMLMVDKDLDDPQLSRFVHILRVFYRYIYNQGATVREKSLIAHLLQMPAFEEFNSRDAKDVIDFANTFLDIYIALCVEIDCKFASIEMDYVCDRLQASLREHTDADIIYVVIPFDRTFITDVAKQHIILENTTHYLHGAVLYNGHGSIGHYTSFVISDRRIYMYENHNNLRELSSQTPYEKYMARILIYVKKLRPQQLNRSILKLYTRTMLFLNSLTFANSIYDHIAFLAYYGLK
jgi:hypothetical protein